MEREPIITFDATVRSGAKPGAVYDLLADPATHLEWAGTDAPDKSFRLLTLEGPKGPASLGTSFESTGANSRNGATSFHDRSTVIEAIPPAVFAFGTDSRLVRKHRPTWHARFVHRYSVVPEGSGCRVDYTCAVYPLNYRPYWLHPLARPATRRFVGRLMTRNMENLARMAESVAVDHASRRQPA